MAMDLSWFRFVFCRRSVAVECCSSRNGAFSLAQAPLPVDNCNARTAHLVRLALMRRDILSGRLSYRGTRMMMLDMSPYQMVHRQRYKPVALDKALYHILIK